MYDRQETGDDDDNDDKTLLLQCESSRGPCQITTATTIQLAMATAIATKKRRRWARESTKHAKKPNLKVNKQYVYKHSTAGDCLAF